ncbi:MAG TPA: VOC family protein [Solirubrobacterales bacterium]|nr:VOC family protein [Solirubrobacterales bacterium]
MSERTSYVPGTPCWVDLGTPDVDAAASFYGELFGWEVPERPDSGEMGGYRRAELRGKDVAGMMPLMQEGQPPAWSTYVSVDDADAIGRAIQENGGTMIAEPMAVRTFGRLALFTDPQGAFFGLWEPADFAGAELVNEPGAVGWNELSTRDPEGAKAFYGAIFGWEPNDLEMEDGGTYTEWRVEDQPVGGMLDMRGRMPDEVPPHWGVYFGTEDTDATVEKVKELGGGVLFGPMDIEPGRFATVKDPFGAFFNVMQPSEQLLARMAEEGK